MLRFDPSLGHGSSDAISSAQVPPQEARSPPASAAGEVQPRVLDDGRDREGDADRPGRDRECDADADAQEDSGENSDKECMGLAIGF